MWRNLLGRRNQLIHFVRYEFFIFFSFLLHAVACKWIINAQFCLISVMPISSVISGWTHCTTFSLPVQYSVLCSKRTWQNTSIHSPHTHTHNRFTVLFPGPPRWAGARRELLDFMVQGEIYRGRQTDHPAGRHSIQTNQCLPPPSPPYMH